MSQSSTAPKTAARIRIQVVNGGMEAWAEVSREPGGDFSTTVDDLLQALVAEKIAITDDVRAKVASFIESLPAHTEPGPAAALVACGTPATEALDGDFQWSDAFKPALQDWQADSNINYYTLNTILTVAAGSQVGRIVEPQNGQPGCDVYGRQVAPRRLCGEVLRVGDGLTPSPDDPTILVTTRDGRVVREGRVLIVRDVLNIGRDVDFTSGNVKACTDVHVRGVIKNGFEAHTNRSLTVDRAIEGATVSTGADLVVRNGIYGVDGSCVSVGGNATAAICDNATLSAGGDLRIGKEIINSRISVGGSIVIEGGTIIGGDVHARNGIRAARIGNSSGAVTRVSAGLSLQTLAKARTLDRESRQLQKKAEEIREKVKPLMANLKRLTPEQREQATEFLSRADELEVKADELVKQRADALAADQPTEDARISFSDRIHAGVYVAIGAKETQIRQPIRGPAYIAERQFRGVTQLVLVFANKSTLHPLPTASRELPVESGAMVQP
ncbi:MAG: DUF342 domain-containing protein [Planctomycetes bacterium]|nr:DUF342 domain-containing protein [Planctomycetota bacterium]